MDIIHLANLQLYLNMYVYEMAGKFLQSIVGQLCATYPIYRYIQHILSIYTM